MSADKQSAATGKSAARPEATASRPASPTPEQATEKLKLAKAAAPRGTPAPPPAAKVPALFRPIDWVTLLVTALVVFLGYLYTVAPDVTLEDSGELAVGSFYAGVPHPPGYPVWTVYTWLFTELIPISNIAYRVALSSAFAGALACGLIGLMVSRGSSMMIESVESLRNLDKSLESAICLVTGFVAGMLMGFNGFMWSQSVIVEVYSLSVLSLVLVLVFLLRWMHAPQQNRYLYLAFLMFGICFTNHQTLLLAAMGIELAIIMARPRLGRDLMLANSLIFIAGLLLYFKGQVPQFAGKNNVMFQIFMGVGLASLAGYAWLTVKTEMYYVNRDVTLLAMFLSMTLLYGQSKAAPGAAGKGATALLAIMFLAATAWLIFQMATQRDQFKEFWIALVCGALFIGGASLYLLMPIFSMTNPPMNWGYPRTEDGFWHALTRGQYEKANPVNIFTNPMRFVRQLWDYSGGMIKEFTLVYLVIGLVPFLHLNKMQKRERAWIIGLTGIYFCLAVLLLIMLNPSPDRQSQELNRVFFTSSHVMVSMAIGYGLALLAAMLATDYQRYRFPTLIGVAAATGIALYVVVAVFGNTEKYDPDTNSWFYGIIPGPSKSSLVRLTVLYSLALALAGLALLGLCRKRVPMAIFLFLMFLLPFKSVLSHWEDNEQRGHLFGYWFGHDMFTPPFKDKDGKPLFPEMDRDTVLFGGTDPGRFNPTYMIFCESFTPAAKKPKDPLFDRRDVYLITQNALADGTYLNYIRAHYNRSAQIDPPFFQELLRSPEESQKNLTTNWLARLVSPLDKFFLGLGDRVEKRRRAGTSFFQEDHFTDLAALAGKLQKGGDPAGVSKFIAENLSAETKALLASPGPPLAKALAKDLNQLLESGLIYESNRFAGVTLKETTRAFIRQNPQSHTRIRLNRLLLEEAYPKEIARSLGGVYPDREILTPTPEDSQRCFSEYLDDVQKRMQKGQLRPGEDVRVDGGRVQVSGQVAVMAINALLTKVIFDKNPTHSFYVEESFPLDWMYPHLEPYGIIMKIARQPMADLPEDLLRRDHEFWSQYSTRTVGNWITYDTPVSNICKFAEDTYLHRDYSGFTGDRKFIRDDNAQKAFSKLRSSIAGVYAWRLSFQAPPQYRPKTAEARARLMKEAEFAFKQALAFCPFSPEAVFRYINLLLTTNQPERINDAILIAKTCKKLDPGNGQIEDLVQRLEEIKKSQASALAMQSQIGGMESAFQALPSVSNGFPLAQTYLSMGRTNDAVRVLSTALMQPNVDANGLLSLAGAFVTLNQVHLLEQTLIRLVRLTPDNPDAHYDLAGVQAIMGQQSNALASLQKALALSAQRKKKDPQAKDLKLEVWKDGRFNALRNIPEFQKLMAEQGP